MSVKLELYRVFKEVAEVGTSRLRAKPDMALPSMDTTLPSVMMVKSRVHRGATAGRSSSVCFIYLHGPFRRNDRPPPFLK